MEKYKPCLRSTNVTCPGALEQSTSRALFLVVVIANTASVQYTYDKGNLPSVQRTNNGKSQTYDFTHDDFGNMLTAKVGSRTLVTNVYGLDSYIGTVYCGVEVTQSGLLAAYHLVGVGNMRDALPTGAIKYDGNGVPASQYMDLYGG